MGFGGISIWQLLILLAIIILVFGTKKLRNIGGDVGGAVHDFRKSMKDGESGDSALEDQSTVSDADGTAESKTDK